MDSMLLRLYLEHIALLCSFFKMADEQFWAGLDQMRMTEPTPHQWDASASGEENFRLMEEYFNERKANNGRAQEGNIRTWWGIHGMLSAAGSISRSLSSRNYDRTDLRAVTGIGEDSLLNSAGLRNRLEHFDEDLEDWWGK